MLNQGLQSRPRGIKGPPVSVRRPPLLQSRAPLTFVKEINLQLLSAGRGQSGRKKRRVLLAEGEGGNLSSEAAGARRAQGAPPPCATGKDNSEGGSDPDPALSEPRGLTKAAPPGRGQSPKSAQRPRLPIPLGASGKATYVNCGRL